MTRAQRYLLATVLLLAALPVGPAVAGVSGQAATATPDAYESGEGDDTPSTAREISVPGPGTDELAEAHTFDVADATTGDEDWIRFTVTDVQADAGYVVLIEAFGEAAGLAPVIEVYAPGAVPVSAAALPDVTDPAATVASDTAPWLVRPGASVAFMPDSSPPGSSAEYRVRVRPAFAAADGFGDAAGSYALRVKFGLTTRLAGVSRYSTASRISFERFPAGGVASGAAVVANGSAFPDALAGSTLAGVLECPLLLTDAARLSAPTRTELLRLGVDTVYLLGGTGAASWSVYTDLRGMGLTVVRVAGADRFATAAAVARTADATAPAGTAPLAFVVNGLSHADALSASAVAAHSGAPVLLTRPETLTFATAQALRDPALGITDVVIVGGTGAVSAATEASIAGIVGAGHVLRLAGFNRYATSREVAVWATGEGTGAGSVGTSDTPDALEALSFSRVGLAAGATFPDALAGGVFCGLAGSPLLLTEALRVSPYIEARFDPDDSVDPGEDYYGAGAEGLGRSYVFGGSATLPATTFTAFDQLTGARF